MTILLDVFLQSMRIIETSNTVFLHPSIKTNMSSFTTIAPEIRAGNIEICLSFSKPAPDAFEDIRQRSTNQTTAFRSWRKSNRVLYANFERTELIPLLLVNKQISTETLASIKKISTKHSYILDIVLYNEQVLLPTWLYLPELSTIVDEIQATIRYIGVDKGAVFFGGDGGPPILYWLFYSLMEVILCAGVIGSACKSIRVRLVEINIESPVVTEGMIVPRSSRTLGLISHSFVSGRPDFMNPGPILSAVQNGISRLLSLYGEACE
jgi:hypothetical protein